MENIQATAPGMMDMNENMYILYSHPSFQE